METKDDRKEKVSSDNFGLSILGNNLDISVKNTANCNINKKSLRERGLSLNVITKSKQKRERTQREIYKEWLKMKQDPNNMAMGIIEILMKKYKVKSCSTIYNIIRKVEKGGIEKC